MARPIKKGLDYYNVDTDRYQDIKIKKLKKEFGCSGIAVYDYLLNEIYRVEGCFIVCDEYCAFDVSDYFGIKESLVKEIILWCCNVCLFDDDVRANVGVLTSKAIQLRYKKICENFRRKKMKIPSDINLLSREETELSQEETELSQEESTRKERKGKEREGKERKITKIYKKKIYKTFNHLCLFSDEFEKLNVVWTKDDIDNVLEKIENYSKNEKYKSLYLTANNWLKNQKKTNENKINRQTMTEIHNNAKGWGDIY